MICSRLLSTHCRNSPSASFFPLMSHKAGYPCAAPAGSVTFKAKTGATITPTARIEKTLTSFLVASMSVQLSLLAANTAALGFTATFCDLVTWLLPITIIDGHQTGRLYTLPNER